MKAHRKSGFTLLEIIIVVIIVGVLASLALPRFFATVEFSRSTEAFASISALRQSVERCFLMNGNTYAGCTIGAIDMADPGTSAGAHFGYAITPDAAAPTTTYTILATRNAVDGGTAGDTIQIVYSPTGAARSGTTAFVGIK